MNKLPYPLFTFFYALIAVIAMLAEILELSLAYYFTKPVLLLMLFFLFRTYTTTGSLPWFRNIILFALFFSFIGDVLLMFAHRSEAFFMAGLIAFLFVHLGYSTAFLADMFMNRPWKQHWGQLAFATMIVVYAAEFYILNRFSFESLWLPVLIYCMAITLMGVTATMRDLYKNRESFFMIVTGSVLFIISDSLLATDKFVIQFSYAGTLILSTYFMAQYLIVTGCLKYMNRKKVTGKSAVNETA